VHQNGQMETRPKQSLDRGLSFCRFHLEHQGSKRVAPSCALSQIAAANVADMIADETKSLGS
jgi:hypothetical protein